ncbi:MAG: hypothetical protein KA521_04125 [Crocinitomicaceae bacterium]|nr:hypothetical protein [Crocinitomicaceae bacterium]
MNVVRLVVFFSLFPLFSGAQLNDGLTSTERAYLFHIVKKSPILEHSIGRFVEYNGPQIRFSNNELNYDSLELLIINQPDLVVIRKSEIAKATKGIINEAANKMAIWELNQLLKAYTTSSITPEDEQSINQFESFLITQLPPNALKEKNNQLIIHPKLIQLLNPSLSFDEKTTLLKSYHFLDLNDSYLILKAINSSVNHFVEQRSFQLFSALGGQATTFKNVLVAAGDGSSTSGLLDEREKDEKGRWNKGFPKAVGLFPYQITINDNNKKDIKIETKIAAVTDFTTVGEHKLTTLHFDVWGYNSTKQTTVVIEKNGLNYHLFGAGDTRFLSPDSTFSAGETFQKTIHDLEKVKIGQLNEVISGKKGFDYWIENTKKKKNSIEEKIAENERKYSELSSTPLLKNENGARKVKNKSYKNGKGSTDYQPKRNANRKAKRKSQAEIIRLYEIYENYKKKLLQLENDKQAAIDLRSTYQNKLDVYKRNMGYKWAHFTEKDGLYIFEDSSTFDIYTQEFIFPAKMEKEGFEVRLLSIPNHSLSKEADEVMLHISMIDAKPNYTSKIQLLLNDVFESDQYSYSKPLFSEKDSLSLVQVFEGLKNKKIPLKLIVRGQGEGKWNGVQIVKNEAPACLKTYPGESIEAKQKSKLDSTFSRLRTSELFIHLDRELTIEINSFTDPVQSNLTINSTETLQLMKQNNWSKNDVLSALRSLNLLNRLKEEINVLAGMYLNREDAKMVIDRFNRAYSTAKITLGITSVKPSELAL